MAPRITGPLLDTSLMTSQPDYLKTFLDFLRENFAPCGVMTPFVKLLGNS